MTTHNHTVTALVVAYALKDAPDPSKTLALTGLLATHFLVDLIPHQHYYDLTEIKKMWKGAFAEIFGGIVILPLVFYWVTGTSLFWLVGCTLAASGFDFLTLVSKWVYDVNIWAHWHLRTMELRRRWVWEIAQTAVLFPALVLLVVYIR